MRKGPGIIYRGFFNGDNLYILNNYFCRRYFLLVNIHKIATNRKG